MKSKLILLILLLLAGNLFSYNPVIESQGKATYEQLYNFLAQGNPSLGDELVKKFVTIYMEESRAEGINWDIAFVQMCLETGFLKYGGLVDSSQNNFCGLGSYDGRSGAKFDTIREGVRAHIQHLKAYGSKKPLKYKLIDPRFHLVTRGSAKNMHDLTGRWAEDPKYGEKLFSLLNRMLVTVEEKILVADATIKKEAVSEEPPKVESEDSSSATPVTNKKRGWN